MAASALPAAWAAGVPGSAALPTLYLQAARQQQQQRARYRDGIAPRCQVAPWLRLQVAQRQVLQPRDIADRGREGLRVVGLVQPGGRAQYNWTRYSSNNRRSLIWALGSIWAAPSDTNRITREPVWGCSPNCARA